MRMALLRGADRICVGQSVVVLYGTILSICSNVSMFVCVYVCVCHILIHQYWKQYIASSQRFTYPLIISYLPKINK